jgi:hypothetical protein
LGGLNHGLLSDAYHPGIAFAVKIPAMEPTTSGSKREAASLMNFDVFIAAMNYNFRKCT